MIVQRKESSTEDPETSHCRDKKCSGTKMKTTAGNRRTIVYKVGSGFFASFRQRAMSIGAAMLAFSGIVATSGVAQDRSVIQRGDAVVTGFAGTVAPTDTPKDAHPLDYTFIDLKGLTAQIFDLSNLGSGPSGQLADAPVKFKATAGQIGHVFGIAFEGDGVRATPNIYLSASSLFGLQLVKPQGGETRRILAGEPGAKFMAGQFGPDRGGPGSIYKVDGRTGQISLFANVQHNGRANSAPGLGNMAYDSRTKQLFVSNLETGMIHRLTMDGRERDVFDHGRDGRRRAGLAPVDYDPSLRVGIESPLFNTEETSTWGFAPKARMTFGLAIQNKRLYYSVAEGPQIWSVGIDDEGDFAKDARLELSVNDTPAAQVVTAIQFDGSGLMYLSQRGEFTGSYDYQLFAKPQQSVVLRYSWDEQKRQWVDVPEEYAIGLAPEHRATVGGIALNYGYDRNGRINYGACRQTLWTTGEYLRSGEDLKRVATGGPAIVHGLQGNYKSKVRPDNEPPFESWFVDYDGRFDDAEINGHIGNVGIFNPCEGSVGVERAAAAMLIPAVVPGEPNILIEKLCFTTGHGGRVRCVITVRNTGGAVPIEDIVFIEDTRVLYGPWANRPVIISEFREDRPGWLCTPAGGIEFNCRLSAADLMPGAFRSIEVWVDTRDLILNGNYGFRNCAILRHPNGSGRACYNGGTDIVVEKTGPLSCKPNGKCRYGLTITNNGDEPFNSGVLLTDQMTIGGAPLNAPITSIAPPLGCSPDPTQVPFACVANVSLAPGASQTTWIEIQIPPGTDGQIVQNCFGASDPWLVSNNDYFGNLFRRTKHGPKGEHGHYSCVRTPIDWPEQPKDQGTYIPVPPGGGTYTPNDPVCWDGKIPTRGGRCVCPGNTYWNVETASCRPPNRGCYDPSRTMPNDQCCPIGTRWDGETRSCRPKIQRGCIDPSRQMPNDGCCPVGTRYNWETKSCRPPVQTCEGGRPPLPNGLCACPSGTRWDPYTRSCGKRGDETGGKCPDGSPKRWGGQCRCPEGTVWNIATQSCFVRETPRCQPPAVFNPATKTCDKVVVPRCPLNQPFYNAQTKRCERRGGDDQPGCKPGQVMTNGQCTTPPKPGTDCKPGQVTINGQCTTPPKPSADCKPGFTKTTSGACLPNSVAQRCLEGEVKQRDGSCKPLLAKPTAKVETKTPPKRKPDRVQVPKKIDPAPKRTLPNKPVISKQPVTKRVPGPLKKQPS